MTHPGPVDVDLGRVVDVRVVLPDHWWRIPLQPPRARERSVDRLLRRQFAGVDNQPRLRAEARGRLFEQAEDAATLNGHLLALCLLEVRGVPLPASLTLYWLDVPAQPGSALDGGEVLLNLRDELQPGGAGAAPAPGFDLARVDAGWVLRRVHDTTADLDGADPVSMLAADYWVQRPDGLGVAHLHFSSPVLSMRQALLDLFDAVVSALRWVRADDERSNDR